jgi:hypothetical protein
LLKILSYRTISKRRLGFVLKAFICMENLGSVMTKGFLYIIVFIKVDDY